MTALITVSLLTLAASFVCSLLEAALYAITPGELELLKSQGRKGAVRLAEMRENIESPIAAILTINTVAHTAGATVAGSLAADALGSPGAGWFAAIFTFLVLAVTEIVPKSIGVKYASSLGPSLAFPLQLMIWISYPIAGPAHWIMNKLTGGSSNQGPSEDEVEVYARLAAKSGAVRAEESRWVRNSLRLDRVSAKELRTPRTIVELRLASQTVGEATANPEEWKFTRVPLTEDGSPDKLVGLVHRRDVFDALSRGETDKTLGELARPLQFVPETMRANKLLNRFIADRNHMVALTDEYGGFEGVVTLEDVLESILGTEIVDEYDEHVDMQVKARENPLATPPKDSTTDPKTNKS